MWFTIEKYSLNLDKVTAVVLQEDKEAIHVSMDNNQSYLLNITGDITAAEVYESITSLLEARSERNDRLMSNGFELSKMTLSELKSITKELKMISQNLRRL